MRSNQPQTIYLSDYKVPAYLVDHVDLRFELFEHGARVHSILTVRRNPQSDDVGADRVAAADARTHRHACAICVATTHCDSKTNQLAQRMQLGGEPRRAV